MGERCIDGYNKRVSERDRSKTAQSILDNEGRDDNNSSDIDEFSYSPSTRRKNTDNEHINITDTDVSGCILNLKPPSGIQNNSRTKPDLPEHHISICNNSITECRHVELHRTSGGHDYCLSDSNNETVMPEYCLSDSNHGTSMTEYRLPGHNDVPGTPDYCLVADEETGLRAGRLNDTDVIRVSPDDLLADKLIRVPNYQNGKAKLVNDVPPYILLHPIELSPINSTQVSKAWDTSIDSESGEVKPKKGETEIRPPSQKLTILCIICAILNPVIGLLVVFYIHRMKRSWSRHQYARAYRNSTFATGFGVVGIFITAIVFVAVCFLTITKHSVVCTRTSINNTRVGENLQSINNTRVGENLQSTPQNSSCNDVANSKENQCFHSNPEPNQVSMINNSSRTQHFTDVSIGTKAIVATHIVNSTYMIIFNQQNEKCTHMIMSEEFLEKYPSMSLL